MHYVPPSRLTLPLDRKDQRLLLTLLAWFGTRTKEPRR